MVLDMLSMADQLLGFDAENDQMVVSVNAPRAEEEEVEIEAEGEEGEEGEESGEDNAEEANDPGAAEDDSDESS